MLHTLAHVVSVVAHALLYFFAFIGIVCALLLIVVLLFTYAQVQWQQAGDFD